MQRILWMTGFWLLATAAVLAQAPETKVALVTAESSIKPGATMTVGVHFQVPAGWHMYWVNPGDAGMPPTVQWSLPAGWSAGEWQWPTPTRMANSAGVDYGYEDEVTLLTPVKVGSAGGDITANLKWLVCKDVCVPQKGSAKTTVRMGTNTVDPAAKQALDAAKVRLPKTMPVQWKVNGFQNPNQVILNFRPGIKVEQAVFFPAEREVIENAATQRLSSTSYAAQLAMSKMVTGKKIARLKGVLFVNGEDSYAVNVPVR